MSLSWWPTSTLPLFPPARGPELPPTLFQESSTGLLGLEGVWQGFWCREPGSLQGLVLLKSHCTTVEPNEDT
jgi:hypothetical protein